MTVYDLNRDQLDELRNTLFWTEDSQDIPEVMEAQYPDEIPDYVVFREFEMYYFVEDDFFCSCSF